MSEAGSLISFSDRESESESSLEGDGGLDELWSSDDNSEEEERPGPGGDWIPANNNGPWIRLMDPADFQPRLIFSFNEPTGPINPPR